MSQRVSLTAQSHFPEGIESSKAARTLIDRLEQLHTGEPELEIDLAGVELKTLAATLIMLRQVRRLINQSEAERCLLSNLDEVNRLQLDEAIALRFDLSVLADEKQSLLLAPRFPTEMIDPESGVLIKIGSARRKMAMVIERDGSGCAWCGIELSYFHPEATLDHVLPHSADGSQDWRNMLLACRSCNAARKRTSAKKWLASCLERGCNVNVAAVEAAIRRIESEPSLKRAFHRRSAKKRKSQPQAV